MSIVGGGAGALVGSDTTGSSLSVTEVALIVVPLIAAVTGSVDPGAGVEGVTTAGCSAASKHSEQQEHFSLADPGGSSRQSAVSSTRPASESSGARIAQISAGISP
mmetsp:Transcript_23766/g.52631  ORF Transcript_23766/g.52631 Transcript_23766/m.52631 type:complete len:106 (-) Transcript_23766:690-1007(-)